MTVQEELTHPASQLVVGPAVSTDWWQGRSADELQAIVHLGAKAGDPFFAAVAEMERRARDTEAARDAQQVEAVQTSRRLGWELKVFFVVATVAVLILLLR
jgi:hypothetical protein